MIAETDIKNIKTHSEQRKYKHIIDIPSDDYANINTVYISDIDILINDKHSHHNIFIQFVNLEYLYIEEKINMTILNNNKLIKNILDFNKLKVFTQLFNNNCNLNTCATDNNKMLIVTSNNIIQIVPDNINNFHILNVQDLNLNNLSVNVEYLNLNVISTKKCQLGNLPVNLKTLVVNYEVTNKKKFVLGKIKIPHACNVILNEFCLI